jgi:hypothetical protein
MGRRRRQGNSTPQKSKNSIGYLVENERNEYPAVDSSRMISMSNELNEVHKEILRKDLKKDIEIVMGKLKKNIQKQLKEYKDNTNKKLEKTKKQLSELREDFNKLQNELSRLQKKRYMR